jgi:hypothetical protein
LDEETLAEKVIFMGLEKKRKKEFFFKILSVFN